MESTGGEGLRITLRFRTNQPGMTPTKVPALPPVTKELVDWVEKTFPDRCPDAGMTDREVWLAAGAAKVARKLRQIHEELLERSITGK